MLGRVLMSSPEESIPETSPTGPEAFSVSIHLEPEDIARSLRNRAVERQLLTYVIVGWIATVLVAVQGFQSTFEFVVLIFSVVVTVAYISTVATFRKKVRSFPEAARKFTFVCQKDRLRIESNLGHADVKWEALTKIQETEHDFLIFKSDLTAQTLPKRFFTEAQLSQLRASIPDALVAPVPRVRPLWKDLVLWILLVFIVHLVRQLTVHG